MSSISESAKYGQKLLDSGAVKYIEMPQAPPAIPAPTNAYPAAPNQYLRAPLPDDMWQQPDGQRQFHIAAIPQTRISPLPENTNPVVGAQAASQSLAIQNSSLLLETNNVVNSVQSILNLKQGTGITLAPDAAGGVVITGTSAGGFAITGVNRQSFGSFDSSYSANNGGATSISVTGTTTGSNELAVVAAAGVKNSGDVTGAAPDGTWTSIGGGNAFQKIIVSPGPLTVTQSLSANLYDSSQALLLFKTNGSVPVFTGRGSGSGGANPLSIGPFTPAAGNSLLFISTGSLAVNTTSPYSAVDSAGNVWTTLQQPFQGSTDGGFPHGATVRFLYAQNIKNSSTTVTITNDSNVGTWALFEISNLGNISSGSYTFQSSDANKLVQFTGGAAVTATLPNPALSSGWIALVSNDSAGAVTITSAAVLNNVIGQNVVIPPGADTWIFSDGTSYWTSTVASYPDSPAQANNFLTGYKAQTGTVLSAQPAFSNLSGNIATSQMNSGTSASILTFWRGDGAWATLGALGVANLTSQGANVAATTLRATGGSGAGLYLISVCMVVTRAATTSSTLPDSRIIYTDQDSGATITVPLTASSTGNTTSTFMQATLIVNAQSSTNIQYDIGQVTPFASSGGTSMQFAYRARVTYLG